MGSHATQKIEDEPLPAPGAGAAGYQGQPGSFGARAAARCGRPVPYPTFEKLLRAVRAGAVDCGLLPMANRAAGALVEPLDALARALSEPDARTAADRLVVTGQVAVTIRLVLAAPKGVATEEIREVVSQAPALRQVRKLLARLDASPVEAPDTAWAAAHVAANGGPRAAVCSEEAALAAGLVVLEEDVSDVTPNVTRFLRLERASAAGARRVDPEVPEPPAPRVVWFEGPGLAASLVEAQAEILALPGPVGGFAVVPEESVGLVAGRKGLLWLGPPPEHREKPRVAALPKATEPKAPSVVRVGPFVVGGGARAVIAGPCAVESAEQVMRLAKAVARSGATALRGGVFKPRTSPYAFQGHGLTALGWLKDAGDAVGLPIVTEVMAPAQVGPVAEKADVLQIGARNCQNYDLLREAGAAGRPVLLKRGFGTTVDEWLSSAEYLLDAGAVDVMLCERGIRTFEKATRGTLDLGGLLAARSLTHLPLLADPSHAAGRRDLVPGLARAAWGAGVDGLIVEVHDAPESALSDGPQALLPEDLDELLDRFGLLPGESGSVERIRQAIDAVDREIAAAAKRRLELCRRVAVAKTLSGRPLRDPAREEAVRKGYREALDLPGASGARLADALISLGLEAEGWTGGEEALIPR